MQTSAPLDPSTTPDPVIESPPLPMILMQMITGYWVSQSIYAAAKLGVADCGRDADISRSQSGKV